MFRYYVEYEAAQIILKLDKTNRNFKNISHWVDSTLEKSLDAITKWRELFYAQSTRHKLVCGPLLSLPFTQLKDELDSYITGTKKTLEKHKEDFCKGSLNKMQKEKMRSFLDELE